MTTSINPAVAPPGARHQRSVRNYLLDSRFQLKYAGLIVAVAVFISAVLGVFLYSTSGEVVEQSQRVVDESRKVSDVVRMNIKNDPIYGGNPELATSFTAASSDTDKKIAEQQQVLVRQQRAMLTGVVGGLSVMVVLIGLLGIWFTHKVAGPIYKMKMLLGQVGDGKLTFHGRLRKGDELQDFFEAFLSMVEKLKERQAAEVSALEAAIDGARASGADEAALEKVLDVRDTMKKALDA